MVSGGHRTPFVPAAPLPATRSLLALEGSLERPRDILAELVVEGDDDVSRARAIVESLGTPNSIVVHRAAVAATPEGRALLRRWDASPDVIHIGHDVDGARPNLKLIHDMTEMEGWIGMAARLRNSGAAPKHRGEELLLRSLKNVEQASSLRWQLLSSP